MPITLSATEARRFRLLSQGLGVGGGDFGGAGPSVADIVERTGGVQAQDVGAAGLQIRARSSGLAARVYTSNEERLAALPEFLDRYNNHRTHSGIGWLPPASRL